MTDLSQSGEVGSASIALTGVPNDVRCVQIDVEGATRSTSQKFTVTPGSDAALTFSGLPLGQLSFKGEAFSKPCDEVGAGDTVYWSADAVTAEILAGQAANVQLVMKRNGRAVVTVSFDTCGGSAPSNLGAACGSCGGTIQCDGACSVATPSNFGAACGSCGGTIQCDGACSVATPANFGAACGGCGGTIQCDGACSVATPGNVGQACGQCGGAVQCDGTCSIETPPDLGQPCGTCGGTVQCNGTCRDPTIRNTCTGPNRQCCETDECGRCTMCATFCP